MLGNDELRLHIMKLRDERGLSQSKLANRMGISRSHMNKLENGSIQISLVYLEQISKVLNVPMSTLLKENEGVTFMAHKEMFPFDFDGVNKSILSIHDEENDFGLTMDPEKLLVTEEKLNDWKEKAGPGAIIIGSVACRYMILTVHTEPDPEKNGYLKATYGFANIDHANWEICGPTFKSTDDLIEWFAGVIENPVIDVIPANKVLRSLPGEEFV